MTGTDESVQNAIYHSIRQQKQGRGDVGHEKRYPPCMFEDLGGDVIVLLSRLSYGLDISIDGYAQLKGMEEVPRELVLFDAYLDAAVADEPARCQNVNIIDLGGGDGQKGFLVATALRRRGCDVTYICYDGSPSMLARNRKRFEGSSIPYLAKQISFEMFPQEDLRVYSTDRTRTNIVLFLGNTYGNFNPEDIGALLYNPTLRSSDLVVIGNKTSPNRLTGTYAQQEIREYWNPVWRIETLKAIGFLESELHNHVAYNPERQQVEMYVFVKDVSNPILQQLGLKSGDIFLTGVSRRPKRKQFAMELSTHFEVSLRFDDDKAPYVTLACCYPISEGA